MSKFLLTHWVAIGKLTLGAIYYALVNMGYDPPDIEIALKILQSFQRDQKN